MEWSKFTPVMASASTQMALMGLATPLRNSQIKYPHPLLVAAWRVVVNQAENGAYSQVC